eukprot:TRINITY_DN7665_c0_g1_i1.p3 TRINITY_DN7665_c0_g1~~TRINITY_DN7665_c0_g1_i1.p3  ORF type:complete len:110 (-),score=24.45 TRINITY_DN7665_c0_g1_i1:57-386(-)
MCIRDRYMGQCIEYKISIAQATSQEPTVADLETKIRNNYLEIVNNDETEALFEITGMTPATLSSLSQSSLSTPYMLSLIHISEPTRPLYISYAVFCLKKKKTQIHYPGN